MRNIYTSKPQRGGLLDRLTLISALTLAALVAVDVVVYKDVFGLYGADITNIEMVSASERTL